MRKKTDFRIETGEGDTILEFSSSSKKEAIEEFMKFLRGCTLHEVCEEDPDITVEVIKGEKVINPKFRAGKDGVKND